MKIQFNTDKNISGDEKQEHYFSSLIADELDKFQSHITRIEVYLTDENGKKEGLNDKKCLLEARIEGKQPVAVSFHANSVEQAISGAIDKLKASLESIIGRTQHH